MLALPLFYLACTSPDPKTQDTDTGSPGPVDTSTPDESAPPPDTGSPLEQVPGTGVPDDSAEESAEPEDDALQTPDEVAIFDDTIIHEVALTLSDEAIAALRSDPYAWTEGDVSLDGESLKQIGVRLRGKIGSFRDIDGKPKFKLDFNQYVEGQEYYGLEGLALNNEVVDCGYIKEPTGYAIYHALGLAAPRVAYASVTVNGESYGLYLLVEVIDDEFLKSRYEEAGGNLYDGKYLYYGGYDYDLVDFTPRLQDNFTLEEGVDVALADVYAITDAILDRDRSFSERLDPLVDLDQLHRSLIAEQWIGHSDGYAMNRNNYRVYFNPWDGRMEMLPWDLDYGFIAAESWGYSWSDPSGALAKACWSDDECLAEHALAVQRALDTVDTDALLARIDGWTALIEDAAYSDPKRECSRASIGSYQTDVRNWIEEGEDELSRFWD